MDSNNQTAQQQSLLSELLARIDNACGRVTDIGDAAHRQADRVFGSVPETAAATATGGTSAPEKSPVLTEQLVRSLDRLQARLTRAENGISRLAPIG